MNETENTDVNPVVEEPSVSEVVAEPQQSDADRNFAALREKQEASERRAEASERRAKEADDRIRQYEQVLLAQQQQQKPNVQSDEVENLDFSDAIDSEALARLAKRLEQQEKKLNRRFEELESKSRHQSLAVKDPGYVDVINKFLPSVLDENPTVKEIIKNTPASKQIEVMYQFAKSNKDYVVSKHIESAKKENRIVEEKPKINTLGAMGGASSTSHASPLNMSDEDFYGEGGYLSRVLENKIS
jgi:hypothetical protein